MKQTDEPVRKVIEAPSSDIWTMQDDGNINFSRQSIDWHSVDNEDEAFFLRILGSGDFRYEGADLGILVTRGRAMTDNFRLTGRAKQWAEGIKSLFSARPLPAAHPAEAAFKIL